MGVATTMAVVGATLAVKGSMDASKARKKAVGDQRDAAIQSAKILAESGRKAEADIIMQNALAAQTAAEASTDAIESIAPFADLTAFQQASDSIIGNLPISGALADKIKGESIKYAQSRPEFFNSGGVVNREIQRQGELSAQAAAPAFNQNLLAEAQQGIAATQDIGNIKARGLERLSDIAGGQASQRASVLVGQTPGLQNLSTGAEEARLLGDIAGSQFKTQAAEQVAGLGGKLFESFKNRPDEFGFKRGEDPFADSKNFRR